MLLKAVASAIVIRYLVGPGEQSLRRHRRGKAHMCAKKRRPAGSERVIRNSPPRPGCRERRSTANLRAHLAAHVAVQHKKQQ